jgi:hypothetical protein
MPEILPAIDIAIRDDSNLFLKRMIGLAEETGQFNIEQHECPMGDRYMEIINFRLKTESLHEGHGFQLIMHSDRQSRIEVEVRAQFWCPDPPTVGVYVDAARAMVGTLLQRYNRSFGSRYRLRVQRSSGKSFRISARTQGLLTRFTTLANVRSLHFYDWERFYAIAREGRQEIPEPVFCSALVDAGFTPERASELAETYGHLRQFKRQR